ncbi:unnamed protein product [Symbiodinium necroappetens]|uniref:Uncharacterized protein n=1 Tax=Symbiodinium necroappetens TaxID=1628268 RepID=A0A812IQU4_9DINO|nr:unnamed protein product [Symbiodinium necroappetens]
MTESVRRRRLLESWIGGIIRCRSRSRSPRTWRSVRAGKVSWTYETVVILAAMTYEHLPAEMMLLLQSPSWRGGKVIKLTSELARPTVAEISLHYRWLKPWATMMPSVVPSGYFITDVFLVLNRLLEGKLLVVRDNESIRGKAAEEACRLRKLIQGLRYLFRSSDLVANYVCKRSRYERVDDLKKGLRVKDPKKKEKMKGDAQAIADTEEPAPIADTKDPAPIADAEEPTPIADEEEPRLSQASTRQLGDRSEDEDFSDKDSMMLLAELTSEEECSDGDDPMDLKLEELQANMFDDPDRDRRASYAGASDIPTPPSSPSMTEEDMKMIASGKKLPEDDATDLEKAEGIHAMDSSSEKPEESSGDSKNLKRNKKPSRKKGHPKKIGPSEKDSGIGVPKGPCLDSAEEDSDSDVQGPGTSSGEKDVGSGSEVEPKKLGPFVGPCLDSEEDSASDSDIDPKKRKKQGPLESREGKDCSSDSDIKPKKKKQGPLESLEEDCPSDTEKIKALLDSLDEDLPSDSDIEAKKIKGQQDGPSDSDSEPKKKKQGSVKLEDFSSPEKDLPSDFDSPVNPPWCHETVLDGEAS